MNRDVPASVSNACTSSMIAVMMGEDYGINLLRFNLNHVQSLVQLTPTEALVNEYFRFTTLQQCSVATASTSEMSD